MCKFLMIILACSTVATSAMAQATYIGDGSNDSSNGYSSGSYSDNGSDSGYGGQNVSPIDQQIAALEAQKRADEARWACEHNQRRANDLAVSPDLIGGSCDNGSRGYRPRRWSGNDGNLGQNLGAGVIGGIAGGLLVEAGKEFFQNRAGRHDNRIDDSREAIPDYAMTEKELGGCSRSNSPSGGWRCQNSTLTFDKLKNGTYQARRG